MTRHIGDEQTQMVVADWQTVIQVSSDRGHRDKSSGERGPRRLRELRWQQRLLNLTCGTQFMIEGCEPSFVAERSECQGVAETANEDDDANELDLKAPWQQAQPYKVVVDNQRHQYGEADAYDLELAVDAKWPPARLARTTTIHTTTSTDWGPSAAPGVPVPISIASAVTE